MTSRFQLSARSAIIFFAVAALLPNLIVTNSAQAQTENKTRQVFEINNIYKILYPDPAPETQESTIPQVDPNIAIVQNYLKSKGSPLADHVETLLQQENWKLVLAISNGESTMCKHQLYNNCWGIGGAWNLKRYDSLETAIPDVNNLLTNKYVAMGADTPQKIVNKYVGHPNANWVSAVNKTLNDLNQLALVN